MPQRLWGIIVSIILGAGPIEATTLLPDSEESPEILVEGTSPDGAVASEASIVEGPTALMVTTGSGPMELGAFWGSTVEEVLMAEIEPGKTAQHKTKGKEKKDEGKMKSPAKTELLPIAKVFSTSKAKGSIDKEQPLLNRSLLDQAHQVLHTAHRRLQRKLQRSLRTTVPDPLLLYQHQLKALTPPDAVLKKLQKYYTSTDPWTSFQKDLTSLKGYVDKVAEWDKKQYAELFTLVPLRQTHKGWKSLQGLLDRLKIYEEACSPDHQTLQTVFHNLCLYYQI